MPCRTKEEIQKIINGISFMDREFRLLTKSDGYLLQLSYFEPDVETGEVTLQRARKWYISPWMTETEIVQTVFLACLQSVEHEARENFLYRKQRIYSPHFDVQAHLKMCNDTRFDSRPDERPRITKGEDTNGTT